MYQYFKNFKDKLQQALGQKLRGLIYVFVLYAGTTVFLTTCKETDETVCKSCTNTQTNVTATFCDDDLEDIQKLEHIICKQIDEDEE